jgi:RNA polymerase sigma-70 factor, ECF subfamily
MDNGNRGQNKAAESTIDETIIMLQLVVKRPRHRPTEESVSAYAQRIYNLARRMLGSDADAEDVTQEVLLTAIRKLPMFRGESSLGTWLYRITINAVLNFRRKQAHRQEHSVGEPFRDLNQPGSARTLATPESELEGRETKQLIERAIATLPEKYRRVYLLADIEELPNAAIAERLSLSLPAVKSQLHRARAMMRTALAAHFEEPRNS